MLQQEESYDDIADLDPERGKTTPSFQLPDVFSTLQSPSYLSLDVVEIITESKRRQSQELIDKIDKVSSSVIQCFSIVC